MRIGEVFPSKYVKAGDIPRGKSVALIISDVAMEEIGQKREQRLVAYFRGAKKGMVLNKTNAGMIAHAYGDETDGWIGKRILLVATTTNYGGQIVPCLRVQLPPINEQTAPAPTPAQPPARTAPAPVAPATAPLDESPLSADPQFEPDDIPF